MIRRSVRHLVFKLVVELDCEGNKHVREKRRQWKASERHLTYLKVCAAVETKQLLVLTGDIPPSVYLFVHRERLVGCMSGSALYSADRYGATAFGCVFRFDAIFSLHLA